MPEFFMLFYTYQRLNCDMRDLKLKMEMVANEVSILNHVQGCIIDYLK